MTTAQFVPFWSEGKNSFLRNPPNADISVFEHGQLRQIVAELSEPRLNDDTLTYTIVRVLEGRFPAQATDVAVFIDVIGMPLTPFSYAGVARRTYRRAYYYRWTGAGNARCSWQCSGVGQTTIAANADP